MKYLFLLTLFLAACAGPSGHNGQAGSPGGSCTVTQAANGVVISCADGSNAVIYNGADGKDGQDGQDGRDLLPGAYSVVNLVDFCGDAPGVNDEVGLVLGNGKILVLFVSGGAGSMHFLTLLNPGNYVTTDGTSCHFTVNADGTISY
jgi:hypothetical protein